MPVKTATHARRALVAVLAAAAGLAAFAVGAPAATGSPIAGNMRMAIDSSPNFSNLSLTAQRHRFVILQAWQTQRLEQLKASNPEIKVLVYKNLSASIASSNGGLHSTGVSHQEADGEHPEWFLKNTSGQRFTFSSYSYLWAMDVGSASYQSRWADNVVAELEQNGWDGVFVDDTNTTMKYHYPVAQIAKYPSDSAWQQATASALAHIGPRVRAAGKVAIPNIGSWGENPTVGRNWLQYVDGAMDEMFTKWGDSAGSGYAWDGHWERQLASLKYAQQQGKEFLAISHSANGDAAAARYGWATVLLGASGRASFALHDDYTNENWFSFYEQQIGEPTGASTKLASGVHRRTFSGGVVVVNPTDSTRTAQLGGTYSGAGRTDVSSIQLAANRAAILTGVSASATDDPPRTSIKPGKKRIKGGKVVAKGRVDGAATLAGAGSRVQPRIQLRRAGNVHRTVRAQLRSGNRFVGRADVCRAGRYRVVAIDPESGERTPWPGQLKVRPAQLRC